jgi:thiamine pyrophosphokinase
LRAVILANGVLHGLPSDLALPRPGDLIIAADGGTRHCRRLGIKPHLVVGDLDSTPPREIESLKAQGVEVIQHPTRKDAADLELALDLAVGRGADDILVLGALGERWDMSLANVMLLALPDLDQAHIRLIDGQHEIICIKGPGRAALFGRVGDTLSLVPLSAEAKGVTLSGLEYPLRDAVIPRGSTWGISNVLTRPQAVVALESGRLLVVLIHAAPAATVPSEEF